MTILEIPLTPQPQKFRITLAGQQFQLTFTWCDPAQCWVMDVADALGTAILNGVAIVSGADLFEQFGYLHLGGRLAAISGNNVDAVPTFANLGISGHVLFVPDA